HGCCLAQDLQGREDLFADRELATLLDVSFAEQVGAKADLYVRSAHALKTAHDLPAHGSRLLLTLRPYSKLFAELDQGVYDDDRRHHIGAAFGNEPSRRLVHERAVLDHPHAILDTSSYCARGMAVRRYVATSFGAFIDDRPDFVFAIDAMILM